MSWQWMSIPVIAQKKQVFEAFDSSAGRAEDCRNVKAGILRSLVQLRLEGIVFQSRQTILDM